MPFFQRGSLNLGFPYYLAARLFVVLSLQWLHILGENFTPEVKLKSPADFKYDVRIDI